MKKPALIISTLLIIAFTFFNCSDNTEDIPYTYVDIILDLNKPDYFKINSVGGTVLIIGGLNGIAVYRKSYNEFQAFERTCTYDPDSVYSRLVLKEKETYILQDTCCGSEFTLLLDGVVTKGPAGLSLKQYRTRFDATNNRLFIFN